MIHYYRNTNNSNNRLHDNTRTVPQHKATHYVDMTQCSTNNSCNTIKTVQPDATASMNTVKHSHQRKDFLAVLESATTIR